MSRLTDTRTYYKPFEYPQFYKYYDDHVKMHWTKEEAKLEDDIRDWNFKTTPAEKNLLTQIFRFFTTGDHMVEGVYLNKYSPIFSGHAEVAMLLSTIAANEAVHMDAYASLIDTLGLPEAEFKAFAEYGAMKDKYEYLRDSVSDWSTWDKDNLTLEQKKEVAKSLAIYSAFTEGMLLFSSFAILLNFSRGGRFKGMCKIVTWSIKDETLHVESMIELFRVFVKENPEIWTDEFRGELYQIAREMVDLEDKFIELAFEMGDVDGLTQAEVKQYIRYIADRRLLQLGLKANSDSAEWNHYGSKVNPLGWLDEMLNAPEHANFFESRSTEYTKGAIKGTWDDVWDCSGERLTRMTQI